MGLFDINALTPEQVKAHLANLDGVTQKIAERFGAYYQQRGVIRDKEELIEKLREFGLRPNAVKKIRDTIDVGPREQLTDFSLFFTESPIDFAAVDENTEPVQEEEEPVAEEPQDNRPLVFIPGILGSELYVVENPGTPKVFRRRVWPPVGVFGIDNLKELAKLIRDQQLVSGTQTSLDAYNQLITNLAAIGYSVANDNLLIFTYNWVRSNFLNGRQLVGEIQKFLTRFNQRSGTTATEVDVICHSMGGLVTRSAIVNHQAPVRKTVYIGTPHTGAPKAYFVLHPGIKVTGFFTELLFDLYKLFTVDEDEFDDLNNALHTLASLCPSVYELLPDKTYITATPMLEIDPGPVSRNFFTRTVDQTYFSGKWQFPPGQQLNVKRGLDFKKNLGKRIPGANLLIACNDLETSDEVEFEFDVIDKDEFEDPTSSPREGDQTVPTLSALGGTLQNSQNFTVLRKTEHTELANAPGSFFKIRQFLGL